MRNFWDDRIDWRMTCSFTSTVAIAAAGTGPVGWTIFAVASLATAVQLFRGRAHLVADDLTRPNTGPQWKWEHETLPAIVDPATASYRAGTLTVAQAQEVITGIEAARSHVLDAVAVFGNAIAAQNARRTIEKITDLLRSDWATKLAQAIRSLPAPTRNDAVSFEGVPAPAPAPTPFETPTPLLPVLLLALFLLLLLLTAARRR